jgi:sugar-specific transcriptional regulator TrmB
MKKILSHLQNLDFTQYESRAYLALLKQGQVSGYELAKNSGIPASKIYAVLNKLLEKEVIIALDSEPVLYSPIPPDDIISRLKGSYQRTFDALSSGLNEIYQNELPEDDYIWNLSGREEIMHRIIEFIGNAKESIYLSVWDEEVTELEAILREAHARGVKMSIVHFGEAHLDIGEEYRHGREHQIRQQRGARRIALEVDGQKVILAHFSENGSSDAFWTNNKGVILLARDYIIHDIYTIRMAEKFGDEALEIFESH